VLSPQRRAQRALTRRAPDGLAPLQANVSELGTRRNVALRMLLASRQATTGLAQREFWREFSRLDQQYRAAVRRLAQFCLQHRDRAP
jgi:hypothetical protein